MYLLSMEKQPQNPEFRINSENFHPCLLNFLVKSIVNSDKTKKGISVCKNKHGRWSKNYSTATFQNSGRLEFQKVLLNALISFYA